MKKNEEELKGLESEKIKELNRLIKRNIQTYLFSKVANRPLPEVISTEDENRIREKIGQWIQKRDDGKLGSVFTPFLVDMENIRDNVGYKFTADVVISIAKGELVVEPKDLDDRETRQLKSQIRNSLSRTYKNQQKSESQIDEVSRNQAYRRTLIDMQFERDKDALKEYLAQLQEEEKK